MLFTRVTKETNVHVKVSLDGTGSADYNTGIPSLDHMLDVSMVYSSCLYSCGLGISLLTAYACGGTGILFFDLWVCLKQECDISRI